MSQQAGTTLDRAQFAELTEPFRRELLAHCYRILGSVDDAEDLIQETYLRAWRSHGGFEGRSSLRTWLFRILVNRARTTGTREHRSIPIADAGPVVDASRFGPDGAWIAPPEQWIEEAESRLAAGKLAELLHAALDDLPSRQREVVTLRDVEGMSSEEACEVLGISEANQRVLLHRGRSKLRQVLEAELREGR